MTDTQSTAAVSETDLEPSNRGNFKTSGAWSRATLDEVMS
jgi:hypothetical protein